MRTQIFSKIRKEVIVGLLLFVLGSVQKGSTKSQTDYKADLSRLSGCPNFRNS